MPYRRKIEEEKNQQTFTNNNEEFLAPLYIGEGRYELYDVLSASGGFGIIFKARDLRLFGHEVLVKARRYDNESGLFAFKNDVSRESKIEKIREKTLFEAECLKIFKTNKESRMPILNDVVWGFSPSICGPHVASDGTEYYINDEYVNDEPYIVMQVVNGTNLGEYVRLGPRAIVEERNYSNYYEWEKQVLEYIKEIATIISNFHKLRQDKNGTYYYIYQDLKPDNIIVSNDRYVTLLDFGGFTKVKVSIEKDSNGKMKEYVEPGFGSPGLGTFGFQAPEARNNLLVKSIDKRCDIYTIGATFYQLLTGFDFADILADENSEIPLEQTLKGICSDSTYNVIKKCLEKDREKRYSDVLDLRRDIVSTCFSDVKRNVRIHILGRGYSNGNL